MKPAAGRVNVSTHSLIGLKEINDGDEPKSLAPTK